MLKRHGILKEFGTGSLKVKEEVAKEPSLHRYGTRNFRDPGIFCLRIDADEYTPGSFDSYLPLFGRYRNAVTIFFNAFSFSKGTDRILKCRDMGIDVQSHAFYHYTYSDYESNLYNIRKAKLFFRNLGVDTTGFASPLGRWNMDLTKALAEEGYKYSSEFSYDYMGFPSYVSPGRGYSKVLEIPVFPVAPELFFQGGECDPSQVAEYYKRAVDFLSGAGLPVIIYAHTNPGMPLIPSILERIADYALNGKGLKPVSMTGIYDLWPKNDVPADKSVEGRRSAICSRDDEFLGVPVYEPAFARLKGTLKTVLDFERVTPAEELKCGKTKKILKLLARKVL